MNNKYENFTFNLKINKKISFIKYKKKIIINYEIAKNKEIVDFFTNLDDEKFDLGKYIVDFVKSHTNNKLDSNDLANIYLNHTGIFEKLKTTYFKGIFNEQKGSKSQESSPISSLIAFISKEGGVNGYDLLYKMTFNDLLLFSDGIIYNLNEQSPKGKKLNRMRVLEKKKKDRTNEDINKIKEKLSLIK